MTTLLEPAPRTTTTTIPTGLTAIPPIAEWWHRLEAPLRREILERPEAPLRRPVVRRILDLTDRETEPVPHFPVRLDENARAYLLGWSGTSGRL
ncbi:hypothetical protein ACGGZK_09490 [Agromyces sp. MMS24-K17]|uniref:hypothetical protein n=1 Tax=Agromyces sp. MMS24-K17 TaxID=3372850 RepID=UPI003754BCC1